MRAVITGNGVHHTQSRVQFYAAYVN